MWRGPCEEQSGGWKLPAAGSYIQAFAHTHTHRVKSSHGMGMALDGGGGSGEHSEDVGPANAQSCCCLHTFGGGEVGWSLLGLGGISLGLEGAEQAEMQA